MKIACIAYLHGFGGAERQITYLANHMAMRNHEVHFIIVAENKQCYEIDSRVIVHSIVDQERGSGLNRIFSRRTTLIELLNKLKCQVIINYNFQSAYFLAFSLKKKFGKIIYSERGDPGDKEYKGLLGLIRSLILHRIDGYVFQSEGARDFFKDEYVKSHCTVIPNACFHMGFRNPVKEREKRIVTVGRLSQQKNQKLLIRAFAQIAFQYPSYILEIYGEGELRTDLEEHVRSLNLSQRILFKGTATRIGEKINNASLFVLSSDYEGIPNALIEAMSLSLPCISTDCKPGGARTLIQSGYNGLLTPIGDVESLASTISYMLSNPKDAERMAHNANLIVETLSPKIIYDKWEQFIYSL